VVGVTELDLGKGGTATRVVDNLLDNSANVTMLFGIVIRAKLDGALASTRVRSEDGGLSLTLGLRVRKEGG
jgi:hypothetical protein